MARKMNVAQGNGNRYNTKLREQAGRSSREVIWQDGNTLRKERVQAAPTERKAVSAQAKRNREKALEMNVRYVVFLGVAAVLTVAICVNYLKLQAQYTAAQKTSTTLSAQLDNLRLDNDDEYNRIIASVNLEHVKDVAMNKLGMVYASADQIVTYQAPENDYVKQYQEIPSDN